MRVVHAVTLLSPDSAFGGPVRVAVNQLQELRRRGHDVMLLAGGSGFPAEGWPTHVEGVPAKVFPLRTVLPGAGFSGLASLRLLGWARDAVAAADVIHVHLARDLVTLPVAALALQAGRRYVVQPHGMVDPSERLLTRPLDALLTRRVLSGAQAVFYLTEQERTDLLTVSEDPDLHLQPLRNGVPAAEGALTGSDGAPEVLFCARLADRKRPLAFVQMAAELLAEGVQARYAIVGPDEGMGSAVRRAISDLGLQDHVRYEGPLPMTEVAARLRRASVYVLPAVDEPYPMTVLESLAVGVPVVCTDSCGLAADVRRLDVGLVTDGSVRELAAAVRSLLDTSTPDRGGRIQLAAAREFSMAAVVDRLEETYGGAQPAHGGAFA